MCLEKIVYNSRALIRGGTPSMSSVRSQLKIYNVQFKHGFVHGCHCTKALTGNKVTY